MSVSIAASRGWIPQTADKMVIGQDEFHLEPIVESGVSDGLVVQSALERVAVFAHNQSELSLSDISRFRRVVTRMQARRAILFVRKDLVIESPITLLATLSKIQIIRLNVEEAGLCSCS